MQQKYFRTKNISLNDITSDIKFEYLNDGKIFTADS